MIKILQALVLVIVASFASALSLSVSAQAQDSNQNTQSDSSQSTLAVSQKDSAEADLSVLERMWAIQQLDYKRWGIRNGCISNGRIKRIKFMDDRSAMINMYGKKKAIMRLENRCPGIKKHGFLHVTDGKRLCIKNSRFQVLGGGFNCKIASIDPYVGLEEPPELQEFD